MAPKWSMATVITAMVVISFIIQGCISRLKKWMIRTKRKALLAALEEIVKEMMLFGLLSLLMGHWTIWFSRICIEQPAVNIGFFACFEEGSQNSTTQLRYGFCPEGLQPFASHENLEQLHRFLLVLGVVHVTYCIFLVSVAMKKINSWRTWESQVEGSLLDDVKTLIIKRQSTYISQGAPQTWSQNKFLLYMNCFISQFWRSIDKAGYMVLRYSFIMSHGLHVSYNFHNYMLRSMEEEFRDIVGIRILFQFWCGYFTFPLYVITTQMTAKSKKALLAKDIRDSLNKWSKRAKYHVLRSSFDVRPSAASSDELLDFIGDEMEEMDQASYINSSRRVGYTLSFQNPVFSPEKMVSQEITDEKSLRVSIC